MKKAVENEAQDDPQDDQGHPRRKQCRGGVLEEKIMRIFISIGIPANIKGYHFLREAIKKAVEDPDLMTMVTKRLYPAVAQSFNTNPSRVECAMRRAIDAAWNKGTISQINQIFDMPVFQENEKPTNGQFIALVAEKMLLESI